VGALYIPTYEYNYKVITGCDTILQEYYITNMAQLQKYKEIYNYELYKRRSRVIKKNSSAEQGAWKDRASYNLSMIHAFTAHLWSATGKITSSKLWYNM